MSPVVEQSVKARLISDAPHPRIVPVMLRYDGADPLAMRMVFPAEVSLDDDEVVWAFARDLARNGLREPAGDGDVHVWPCGRAQTVFEFRAPEGVALVQFDNAPLRRFLKSAYSVVPAGQEADHLDVEQHVGSLII
ncbi:SsgA family sporulation/cell division regulator [Streptomyces sp. NPDC047002]|uniref:SsgA family sporulation/cell division regulator n=1 Tax=Streptomyces sp. NPDC047002 TaxID=3155475 RepID=UPI0034514B5A